METLNHFEKAREGPFFDIRCPSCKKLICRASGGSLIDIVCPRCGHKGLVAWLTGTTTNKDGGTKVSEHVIVEGESNYKLNAEAHEAQSVIRTGHGRDT